MNLSQELLIKFYQNFKNASFNPYHAEFKSNLPYKKLNNTISHLVRVGYIKKVNYKYFITPKGKERILKNLSKNKIKERKWDGKWRVVIFDVPEKKRNFRAHVRKVLYELMFIKLQKSVWITPYDVFDDLVGFLPSAKRGDWIKLLIVDKISNEDLVKKEFKSIIS